MKRPPGIAVFLLCLVVSLSAAYGQGRCTMQNIVGTYAFNFTGTSAIVAGPAGDGFHWDAKYAPIAGVGIFTIKQNGTAVGKYWLVAGTINSGLDAVPLNATVTINADCTGSLESTFGTSVLKERFVVLGNGREIRAVATQTAMPTGNWLTVATRINGACGQHKVHGDYLMECKNLFEIPASPTAPPTDLGIFAGAIHIRTLISPGGDYTGMNYGKVGWSSGEFPVNGHIAVNNDCTAEGTLATPFLPTVSTGKGVFFDEGRQAYWLPLINTLPDGSKVPQPFGYCSITQIDNK